MHGDHGRGQHAISTEMIHERFNHIGKTGRGTGGRRNNGMKIRLVVVIIYAHDCGDGVIWHIKSLGLDLERCGHHDFFSAGLEMTAYRAPSFLGIGCRILENTSGVNNNADTVFLPFDILGVAGFAQHGYRHAIDRHGACGFIYIFNHPATLMTVQIGGKPAVAGILFNSCGNIFQPGSNLTTQVDNDFRKKLPGNMVPEGKFTDSAKAVQSEFHGVASP